MGANVARLLVFGIGLLLTVLGVSLLAARQPFGLWSLVTGLIFIVAAILERARYRSSEAEATAARPGPGGAHAGCALRTHGGALRGPAARSTDARLGRSGGWRTAVRTRGLTHPTYRVPPRTRAILAGQPYATRTPVSTGGAAGFRDGRRRTRSTCPDRGHATPPSRHQA